MTTQGPLGNKQVRVEDFLTIQNASAAAAGTVAVNTVTVNASAGGVPAGAYFLVSGPEPLAQEAQNAVQKYHVWYSKDGAVDPLPQDSNRARPSISNNIGIKVIATNQSSAELAFDTKSDSEILLNVFAQELLKLGKLVIKEEDIFTAVQEVHRRCQGGYAAVALIIGYGLVAFRDPNGIRPIIIGKKETEDGPEYMISSESVALRSLGFQILRDLGPGEVVYIEDSGNFHSKKCAKKATLSPCIFEYVYLARPDSTIDEISVYKSRLRMAEKLGDKILSEWPDHDIDVVIPIPDTSRACALPLAYKLDRKYREGFIKNRYIGRVFIMPDQPERKRSIRHKLNAIDLEFKDKNVLLVDDSIVRGTTSREIIQMARDAGARKVYFASAAPPVRYQNVYGINMPTTKELIAHGHTEEEVCQLIGADRLFYQTLDDLIEAVRGGNPKVKAFDTSCFSGEYPTGGVTEAYLKHLNLTR